MKTLSRILMAAVFGLWAVPSALLAADEPAAEKVIEAAAVDLGRPVDFERDIYPILETNCIACHNLAIDESKLSLEDVEGILKGGKRGPSVVPKEPDKSLLLQVVSRSKAPAMPPMPNKVDANLLTPREVGLIRQWILEGATAGAGSMSDSVQWQPLPSDLRAIYSVALSPWAQLAAAGRANQIHLYDIVGGAEVARLIDPSLSGVELDGKPMYPQGAAHRDFVNSLAFSPDGDLLASGGYRVVKFWKRSDDVKLKEFAASDAVTAVAISSNGAWAAIATKNNTVRLWNLIDGKPGPELKGHAAPVTGLEFWPSPQQRALLQAQIDTTLAGIKTASARLQTARDAAAKNDPADAKLDAEALKAKKEKLAADVASAETALQTARDAAKAAADALAEFDKKAAEEGKLFTGSTDKTVRVWNVKDGSPAGQFPTIAEVNDLTVNLDATQVITAEADNNLRVWKFPAEEQKENAEEPAVKPIAEMKGHSKPVTSVALIYPAGSQVLSGSEDGTVRSWNISNGGSVRTMTHGAPVTDVAARTDGELFASVSDNGIGKLWTAGNGQQKAEFKGSLDAERQVIVLTEEQAVAKQMVTVTDNAQKAAEKNLTDREEGAKKAKEAKEAADKALADPEKKQKEAADKLEAAKKELAAKSDDAALKKKVEDAEKALAAADAELQKAKDAQDSADRALKLAEMAIVRAKEQLEVAKKEKDAADARAKSVDEQLAKAQEAEKNSPQPMVAVAFAPNGQRLVTVGADQQIQLWDGETGKHLDAYAASKAPFTAVAFGPDRTILAGAADKQVALYTATPQWTLVGQIGGKADDPLDLSESPFVSRVLALDFSRDGKYLATGGGDPSRSGELMIWDVEKRTLVKNIEEAHSDTVLGVEFSRDGKQLLSGAADKFVKIFDVASGKLVRSFEGHTHHVMDVSWKADGANISSAGADNAIKVWNVETGEQIRTISTHQKQVTSIQYIGTGENIVTTGGDNSVRMFRSTNGQNYRNYTGLTDYMYSAACSRDESVCIAGGEDGVLRVWDAKTGNLLFSFDPPEPVDENSPLAAK